MIKKGRGARKRKRSVCRFIRLKEDKKLEGESSTVMQMIERKKKEKEGKRVRKKREEEVKWESEIVKKENKKF